MFNYVIRRLLYSVPILLGVIALTFLLFNVLQTPEAAAAMAIGSKAPQQAREAWIKSRGLDRPKTEQFVKHVKNLATFQFGTSWKTGRELNEVFRQGAGPSLLITLPGFLAGLLGGVGLALYQVYVRKSLLDRSITLFAVALMIWRRSSAVSIDTSPVEPMISTARVPCSSWKRKRVRKPS